MLVLKAVVDPSWFFKQFLQQFDQACILTALKDLLRIKTWTLHRGRDRLAPPRHLQLLGYEAHCEDTDIAGGHICLLDWPIANINNSSLLYLLPLYFIVSLGCYGLLMVGVGLMQFPTCPHEAVLLQQDIVEAKEYLKQRGVDVCLD
ncbi:hypothetical protein Vadar_016623 [Vaccinium darrowii]|uniref:Uncharacterized protein n=1 Tax=Vaccinium darrowii TaxID=229202 RepID=A0ACB7ZC86_9ERIC|nr:hypothetical protein Vadar_016623 [Vaccinium darrowii]